MSRANFGILAGLNKARSAGGAVDRNEIMAAACALTLAAEAAQPEFWELLRELAARALPGLQEAAAGEVAMIARFLADTGWTDIAHLVRRDRHLWNVCLHVVRQDGGWLVCDGLFDGLLLLAGPAGMAASGRVGEHAERTASEAAIASEIGEGLHLVALGRTPPLAVLFQNGRPVDQSQSLAKFCGFLEEIDFSHRLYLHFLRQTAFFDPAVLGKISEIPSRSFFSGKPILRHGGKSDSIVEAFYLPCSNTEMARHCSVFLADQFRSLNGPPADPARDDGLRLFISLELEKRVWIEQIEGLERLFNRILKHVPTLQLVVNGMTGTIFGGEDKRFAPIRAREQQVIAGWQQRCGSPLEVQYLGGLNLTAKLKIIATCDFFVTPAGTAAWIPLLAGVPGVYYSNPELQALFEGELQVFSHGRLICRNQTIASSQQKGFIDYEWAREDAQSYSIKPEAFVAEAMLGLSRCPRFSHL